MSSERSASTEPGPGPEPSSGPSRNAVAWVVVTLALLVALVWALNARQPKLTPAPLGPPLEACARLPREFTPTDATDLGEPPFTVLPREQKYRALRRMNTEECPCGCKLSIASCRLNDPSCKTSAGLTKKIVESTSN